MDNEDWLYIQCRVSSLLPQNWNDLSHFLSSPATSSLQVARRLNQTVRVELAPSSLQLVLGCHSNGSTGVMALLVLSAPRALLRSGADLISWRFGIIFEGDPVVRLGVPGLPPTASYLARDAKLINHAQGMTFFCFDLCDWLRGSRGSNSYPEGIAGDEEAACKKRQGQEEGEGGEKNTQQNFKPDKLVSM